MKKVLLTAMLAGLGTMMSSAEDLEVAKPDVQPELAYGEAATYRPGLTRVEIPEFRPELKISNTTEFHSQLDAAEAEPRPVLSLGMSDTQAPAARKWTWMNTNPGVKPYKVKNDLTFVGIPVFAAGWIIKGEKSNFKQDSKTKASLVMDFKTSIDDYSQYFGPAMTLGLKIGGVEGRSDWGRLLASSAMSYGIMAALVNGIKYTAKEMRPDGSQANSWPSGHTATSFVGATILHKEYGMTRSPWYSVAGYGVATATGVMRILNNRHWISDVFSGAGIGIMSTEVAYALSDVLFKGKGLLRNDLQMNDEDPSYFSVSMGMGWGLRGLSFNTDDLTHAEDAEGYDDEPFDVDFHAASVVDAEGVYFFNKYVGIGGRLRVRAMTAKSWNNFVDKAKSDREELGRDLLDLVDDFSVIPTEELQKEMGNILTSETYTIVSDHLTEFSANVGLYFNLPLSSRLSLGSKLLIGRSLTQELDIDAHYQGDIKDVNYRVTIENGELSDLEFTKFASAGKSYDLQWDYLSLGGNNSTTYGTGLSLSYRYKSNFSWRIFADYDYSEKTFTLTYDPYRYLKVATLNMESLITAVAGTMEPIEFKKRKNTHYFTIGASFVINF